MQPPSMNLKDLLLPFPEDEIEWRIAQAGKNGEKVWASCLAYISARSIMDRLDQVCGPEKWKVEYYNPDMNTFICKLSIKCGEEWITKEDGAEKTDIESVKGGISSALKRAGSVWGIGRYLYGLESGFVQIVEKGSKGARYGRLPDKSGGSVFYWIPPKLPEWALPAVKKEAATPEVKFNGKNSPSKNAVTIPQKVVPQKTMSQNQFSDFTKEEDVPF